MTTRTPANPWDEPAGILTPRSVEVYPRAMVTGHRPKYLTESEMAWSQVALHHTAWRLRSVYGTQHAIAGGALGADTIWALAALAAGMHLHLYIPFEDQPNPWPAYDQAVWAELRRKAKTERIIGGKTYDVKMLHARNDAMLADADLVVALYIPGETGGTASAVAKARSKRQPLLLLDPRGRTIRWDETTRPR